MTSAPPVLAKIQHWLAHVETATDAELVELFVRNRDEGAFAAIVDRHGPMVLGVARRIAGNHHLAEDIFQAAFLTLARRAQGLRNPAALPAWLHRTACQLAKTSVRAKFRRERAEKKPRRIREHEADPLAELSAREFLAVVDKEMQRLPESLRQALVLCCLEGRSQEEAAAILGWTSGAVRGRLERGRRRLAARLERRGLTLAVSAGMSLLLAQTAIAQSLRESVVAIAVGRASPIPAVATLTQSALRATVPMRRLIVTALIGVAGIGTYTLVASQTPPVDKTPPPSKAETPPAANKSKPLALPDGAVARLGWDPLRVGSARAALTPDGKKVIVLSSGSILSTYDAITGNLLERRALGERREVPPDSWHLELSADGKIAAVEDGDGSYMCSIWDLSTNRKLQRFPLNSPTRALSPDGRSLATNGPAKDGDGWAIRLIDTATGESSDVAKVDLSVSDLRFSPDGKRLLARMSEDKGAWVCYDVPGAKALWKSSPASGASMCTFAPDGKTLFVTEVLTKEPFRALDVETGSAAEGVKLPKFDANGVPAAAGDRLLLIPLKSGEVAVWDYREGKELRRLRAAERSFLSIHLFPAADGKTVVTYGDALRRWDLATGEQIFGPAGDPAQYGVLNAVAFLPNGELMSSSLGGELRRWDVSTGRTIGEPGRGGSEIRATPSGVRTAKLEWPHVSLRDTSGKVIGRARIAEDKTAWTMDWNYALLADGRRVIAFNSETKPAVVRLVDCVSSKLLSKAEIPVPEQFDYFQGFSPCGRWIVANAKVFSVSNGKEVWAPSAGEGWHMWPQARVWFSPDSRLMSCRVSVASSADEFDFKRGEYDVFEIASGTRIARFAAKHVSHVTFSPDNRTLAYVTGFGIHLFDLASGKLLAEYEDPGVNCSNYGFTGEAPTVAFSADGRTVATGHHDGSILIWKVPESKVTQLKQADRDKAWDELAGDGPTARQAISRLSRDPTAAIDLLSRKFKAPVAPKDIDIPVLIRDLDSPVFATREKANQRLKEAGLQAEPALCEALKAASAEMKQRIDRLLADLNPALPLPLTGENLRGTRAIEILGHIDKPAAKELLRAWSEQAANAYLAAEARRVLESLQAPLK